MGYQDTTGRMDNLVPRARRAKKEQMGKEEKLGCLEPQESQGQRETLVNWACLEMRAQQGRRVKRETKGTCPMTCSLQVPKATQAHQALQAHLGPRALQDPRGPREPEDPKALGSQTCSTASAQVRHVLSPMTTPWWEKPMRKAVNTIPHKRSP